MAADRERVRVHVSGRVQGVFFRDSAREKARELGAAGWAENLPDGRVELVAEGSPEAVRALVDWAREGPEFASVTDVEVSSEDPEDISGFEAR
jgi:acylphosphatase